jgi:hypothetical protein
VAATWSTGSSARLLVRAASLSRAGASCCCGGIGSSLIPGISDSEHHVYLADGAERTGPPEDDFESEHVSWVPLAEIPGLISRGDISSGTTLAALLYTLVRTLPES